ncbi:MAG: hypothetical protein HUN05_08400 [Desulfobacter sp.]|nr:MAG: hypothetical protein HUN05_08400 [Desulfobacter sp.]
MRPRDFSIAYALSTLICYALLLPVIKLLPDSTAIFCLTSGVCLLCLVTAVIHNKFSTAE